MTRRSAGRARPTLRGRGRTGRGRRRGTQPSDASPPRAGLPAWRGAVPRLAPRHQTDAATRARQEAAKAARSAVCRPLAANWSQLDMTTRLGASATQVSRARAR